MADLHRVIISRDSVSVSAPGTEPLVFSLDQIVLTMLWSCDDERGHAHLIDRGSGPLELLRLEHRRVVHDEMMALHAAATARLAPGSPEQLRAQTRWWSPDEPRWSFFVDAGRLQAALEGGGLIHRAAPRFAEPTRWTDLPEAFLRDPVAVWVAHELGEVRWAAALGAAELRPEFHGARAGEWVALAACRYGSRHAGHGQDRTAAVFLSTDGGQRFEELPWELIPAQRSSDAAEACWPPEQIPRLRLFPPAAAVEIEWDDPWIDWEPGTEWMARWDGAARRWTMARRNA
jgi:hypothetical protein